MAVEERSDGMNEELGVLINSKRAYFMGNNRDGFPLYTVNTEYAHKCTRKEAEQFPQFKWVSLEDINESKN